MSCNVSGHIVRGVFLELFHILVIFVNDFDYQVVKLSKVRIFLFPDLITSQS